MNYNFAQIVDLFKPDVLIRTSSFFVFKFAQSFEICLYRPSLKDPVHGFVISTSDPISPDSLYSILSNNPCYSHIDFTKVNDMEEIRIETTSHVDTILKRCLGLTGVAPGGYDPVFSGSRTSFPALFSNLFFNPYSSIPGSTLPFPYVLQTSNPFEKDLLYFSKDHFFFRFGNTSTFALSPQIFSNSSRFLFSPNPYILFRYIESLQTLSPPVLPVDIRFLVFGKDISALDIHACITKGVSTQGIKYQLLYNSPSDLSAIVSFLCRYISLFSPFSFSFSPSVSFSPCSLSFQCSSNDDSSMLFFDQLLADINDSARSLLQSDHVSFFEFSKASALNISNNYLITASIPNHTCFLKSVVTLLLPHSKLNFELVHVLSN